LHAEFLEKANLIVLVGRQKKKMVQQKKTQTAKRRKKISTNLATRFCVFLL